MEQSESPMSSDSAHTPLQDEHTACDINTHIEIPVNIEIGENVDMIEEQLDYEEFVENNEETKPESEAEEGEYNSTDDNDVVICEVEEKKSLENGEIHSDEDEKFDIAKNIQKMSLKKSVDNIAVELEVVNDDSKCEGELADGELKAEEEEIPLEETPWERGLRLARERRELAKLKKVQEKDKLKERQLHINLDNIEEVEPICKPQTDKNYEVNHKLLKAMQPIVILPEEPRHNEMILEYYLAESDYQHRPRFIPSRLYTLDPWEVDEWKRELDMMKMENEIERIASNKHKRALGMKSARRTGRRGSVSSSGSSRSSSVSENKAIFNQSNRTYEFQTSQYALSRNKPALAGKNEKPPLDDSINKLHMHRGRRDLPPEFKNRIVSSSRSSSRSSSGSHSSSSGSSTSSRSTSSPRASPKKRATARGAAVTQKPQIASSNAQQQPPMFRTIKKPALGRARSDSSASSKSSDSSSTSSDSSSSRSSGASSTNASRKLRKSATATAAADSKQFINSWFAKTPQNPLLEATVVPEVSSLQSATGSTVTPITAGTDERALASTGVTASTVAPLDTNECELPSASSRPGVKLKLLSRPKPVILPNHSSTKQPVPAKEKLPTKKATGAALTSATTASVTKSVTTPSSIFNNSKSIFSTLSGSGSGSHHSHHHRSGESLAATAAAAKESAFKSNLAATQLEMQQEFLRNYKDKIAIYRSQLSYQQQQLQHHHPGGCTLAHAQPPPIKGPITVMSVTSKKTGPPKTQVKVTDRYSQHEEHSHRYNSHSNNNNSSNNHHNNNSSSKNHNSTSSNHHHNSSGNHQQQHYSPNNYRNYDAPPSRNRNRSRSFDNDRGGRNYFDKAPQRDYGSFRSSRNNDNNSGNKDGGSSRYGEGRFRSGGGDKQHDKFDRRSDFDRGNRFEGRGEERSRREDRHYRSDRGDSFNRNRGGESDNNNNNRGDFGRSERPRDRFRDNARPADYEDRYSDSNNASAVDKHHHHQREDYFESGGSNKSRPRNLDRDSLGESGAAAANTGSTAVGNHHAEDATAVQKPAAATTSSLLLPVAVVPKEKRREELLKQLKAVEDAIAKKKAKIDK